MRTLRSLGFLLLAGLLLGAAMPAPSQAQIAVGVSVRIGPPVLPVYAQPICPGPGYIWTPGYWAWSEDTGGYYWVPGTWVLAPEPGFLWTPGYWGFADGAYLWHAGYWGPHVGFYGGINYGYGYTGVGFYGGEWRGREFVYNRSVTNINVTVVHNYYNRTVIVNENHVAFNGGPHGVMARPTHDDERWAHERHIEARHEQMEHEHAARADRRQWASENHGRPEVAAAGRAGDFHHNVIAAREASHREAVRNDRPEHDRVDNRGAVRNDRPNNARVDNRRDDRPNNAHIDNRRDDRPGNAHVDNRRDNRPVQDSRGHGPDPRGEARGNPHVNNAPAAHGPDPRGEARGNPHVDHAAPPPQHGADHGSAAHGSAAHGSAAHGNEGRGNSSHPDNGKSQDHGKDRGKP